MSNPLKPLCRFAGPPLYIGVDLHQNRLTTCRLEADATEAFEIWAIKPEALERFGLSLTPSKAGTEYLGKL